MASSARSRSFVTVDAVGSKELVRAFQQLARTGVQEHIIAPTLEEAVDLVYRDVESRVPVRTGGLKDTLRKRVSKTIARITIGNKREHHGKFLEFGTSKMPARPFMRPALDGNRRAIEGIAVKHMNRALAMLGRGGSVYSAGGRGRFKRGKSA